MAVSPDVCLLVIADDRDMICTWRWRRLSWCWSGHCQLECLPALADPKNNAPRQSILLQYKVTQSNSLFRYRCNGNVWLYHSLLVCYSDLMQAPTSVAEATLQMEILSLRI